MVALLIAMIAATGLLWSPAADAHPVKPAIPAGATVPATATAPVGAAVPPETPALPAATDSSLLILVVLVAAAGAPCLVRRLRRPTLALATTGLLVSLLGGSAPHLVHHAFEPGKGAECQILQVASHADGALDTPETPLIILAAVPLDPDPRLPVCIASTPAARTRAPPA